MLKTFKEVIKEAKNDYDDLVVIIHNFENKKYVNEVYRINKDGSTHSLIPKSEVNKLPLGKLDKQELTHGLDYEKVKAPFKDENGKTLYLYGRYIFIGSRPDKYGSRF